MQIKLATARGLGYTGDAAGLRDPDTNLAYGIKYLAGAYRAANSDHSRAMHYYASGYYYAAKRQRLSAQAATASHGRCAPQFGAAPARRPAMNPADAYARAGSAPDSRCGRQLAVDTPCPSAYIRPVPRGAPRRS